jgi:type IV pilus assembly protein PilW
MSANPNARAHTLLELLIALSVGLLVLAAVVALYHAQRVAQRRADDLFRMRDAASTALTLIGQQIQMAGFRPLDAGVGEPAPALFGCASAALRGTDAQPWCEAVRGASDALRVRYVADTVSTWPTANGSASDCLGQGVGGPSDRPLVSNRFDAHVSPSTGESELYCDGSGRPGVPQPLVAGVEQLRFRYWRRGAARFVDGDAMRADDWASVVAVQLCVQVRGEPMRESARHVDCDGNDAVSHDGRARIALQRVVAVRNAIVGGEGGAFEHSPDGSAR